MKLEKINDHLDYEVQFFEHEDSDIVFRYSPIVDTFSNKSGYFVTVVDNIGKDVKELVKTFDSLSLEELKNSIDLSRRRISNRHLL